MMSSIGYDVPDELLGNYLLSLVDQFYKILPLREIEEPTLPEYIKSLQAELLGFQDLMTELEHDARLMRLLAILQHLRVYDCEVDVVKREVFKAISLCKKLKARYCREESRHEFLEQL